MTCIDDVEIVAVSLFAVSLIQVWGWISSFVHFVSLTFLLTPTPF